VLSLYTGLMCPLFVALLPCFWEQEVDHVQKKWCTLSAASLRLQTHAAGLSALVKSKMLLWPLAQCTCTKKGVTGASAFFTALVQSKVSLWPLAPFTCTKQGVTVASGTIYLYKAMCHCGHWYHSPVQSKVSLWPLAECTCTKQGVLMAMCQRQCTGTKAQYSGHTGTTLH